MNNKDLRISMLQANVKQYEVARQLGITESNFCRKLRYELPQEEKEKILQVIEELKTLKGEIK